MKPLLAAVIPLSLIACSGAPLAKRNKAPDGSAANSQAPRPAAATVAVVPPQRLATFPSYTAENLNGKAMTIPNDLRGPTLLLVGFKRWHQRPIDEWLRAAAPLFERYPGFDYMELPVIRRMGSMSRWWLDNAMRRGIPERNKRARVVTLYLNKDVFRGELSIPNESDVRVYLVRPSGEIL